MKKLFFLISVIGLFYGCAYNSGVLPVGNDGYMVSRQARTGFFGMANLKAEAIQEATTYCESKGKTIYVTSTSESKPPFILANYPRAEVQFECVDK